MATEGPSASSSTSDASEKKMETMKKASDLIAQGKRNMVCREIPKAVNFFEEAVQLLVKECGELSKDCAEAYFCCGNALLELGRMETNVLGVALEGVDVEEEKENESSEQFEKPPPDEGEERQKLREEVYEAMAEGEREEELKKAQVLKCQTSCADKGQGEEMKKEENDCPENGGGGQKNENADVDMETDTIPGTDNKSEKPENTEDTIKKTDTNEKIEGGGTGADKSNKSEAEKVGSAEACKNVSEDKQMEKDDSCNEKAEKDKSCKRDNEQVEKDESCKKDNEQVEKDESSKRENEQVEKDESSKKENEQVEKDESSKKENEQVEKDESSKKENEQVEKDDSGKMKNDSVAEGNQKATGEANSIKARQTETESSKEASEDGSKDKTVDDLPVTSAEESHKSNQDKESSEGEELKTPESKESLKPSTDDSETKIVESTVSGEKNVLETDKGECKEKAQSEEIKEKKDLEGQGSGGPGANETNDAKDNDDVDMAESGAADEGDEEAEDEEEMVEESLEGEDGDEKEEDVPNFQLAWEYFELAKVIYSKSETDEDQLLVAECHIKLGEVSMETEQHDTAADDLENALKIRKKCLPAEHRLIAETHYQLGLAYGLSKQFELSIQHYQQAIDVIEAKIASLNKLIDEKEIDSDNKENQETGSKKYKDEIKELQDLLPEIKTKVEDTRIESKEIDQMKQIAREVFGLSDNSKSFGSPKKAESNVAGGTDVDENGEKKPSDIAHLVRKKRKPEDDTVSSAIPEVKKIRQDDAGAGDALVNGTTETEVKVTEPETVKENGVNESEPTKPESSDAGGEGAAAAEPMTT